MNLPRSRASFSTSDPFARLEPYSSFSGRNACWGSLEFVAFPSCKEDVFTDISDSLPRIVPLFGGALTDINLLANTCQILTMHASRQRLQRHRQTTSRKTQAAQLSPPFDALTQDAEASGVLTNISFMARLIRSLGRT